MCITYNGIDGMISKARYGGGSRIPYPAKYEDSYFILGYFILSHGPVVLCCLFTFFIPHISWFATEQFLLALFILLFCGFLISEFVYFTLW